MSANFMLRERAGSYLLIRYWQSFRKVGAKTAKAAGHRTGISGGCNSIPSQADMLLTALEHLSESAPWPGPDSHRIQFRRHSGFATGGEGAGWAVPLARPLHTYHSR